MQENPDIFQVILEIIKEEISCVSINSSIHVKQFY